MSVLRIISRLKIYGFGISAELAFLVMLLTPLLAGNRVPLRVQSLNRQEYQIRAVFLFNFTQFIEWPPAAFPKEDSPLIIGVLGQNPFGNLLEETVHGEAINGHPLVVKRFNKVEEIGICHILYINLAKSDQLTHVFENLKGQNVLTVGDAPNFVKQGGMIRFFTENNKTRIRINLESTKEAEIVVSSKLLRLAEIVESSK